ncbi:MAG: hypothetical protein II743_01300 [Lachnospiraceae bacterium]|nr:hypothetical protein [Lachnospiraceae bacterium]
MYYYPDNLRSSASVWLWKIRDLCIAAALAILGALAMAGTGSSVLMVIAVCYAVMTMQADEVTIMDFIIYACRYFLLEQQEFEWRLRDDETEDE